MKQRKLLIKFLRICCVIGEIFTVVGLAAVLVIIPFLETMVDSRQGSIGMFVNHGSPSLNFNVRLPHTTDANFAYDQTGLAAANTDYGNISFGPLRLHLKPSPSVPDLRGLNARGLEINNIEGTVTIEQPEKAAEVFGSVKWPFIAGVVCLGGAGLVILDLFRRMFRSAERNEVFTAANIRNVRIIGFLLIASSILKLLTSLWLVNRMATYVMQHVTAGTVSLESSCEGSLPGFVTGLMILALAEVFRQGLLLREENQLTV
jgi:hypothetical protein